MNRNVFITLQWDIYIYITSGTPSVKVDILWRHANSEQTSLQNTFRHYLEREAAES